MRRSRPNTRRASRRPVRSVAVRAAVVGGAARVLYDVRPDEPVNFQRFMTSLHPEDRDRVDAAVQIALRHCGEFRAEYRVASADGVVRWLYAMGSCRLDRRGHPRRLLGASLDLTDRRDQEARLRNALAEVQRLQAQLQQENLYLQQE